MEIETKQNDAPMTGLKAELVEILKAAEDTEEGLTKGELQTKLPKFGADEVHNETQNR